MAILAGKVGIVTGAGQGVGRGIALALAKEGAALALCDRNLDTAQDVADEIAGLGGRASAMTCDVRDARQIAAVIERTARRFGGIDILVNNAYSGAVNGNPLADADDALFVEGFESGPLATLRFMRGVYPHMKARGGGSIVNLGTSGGVRWDMSGYGLYGAVKEAIRVLTRAAACEWGADRIRVNTVAPLALSPALAEWSRTCPEEAQAFFAATPQNRAGDCEIDIGRAVVFLVGPDAGYLSGATIPLDGGQARFG